MKYKVGDRVRIKSLDWYNENKKKELRSCIECGKMMFTPQMSKWCGKIVTIIRIENDCYRDENAYYWTDEMIEGLVEEETSIKGASIWPIHWHNVDLSKEIKCPEGYQFKDENGNVINATKIVLEKKKKCYPKTYEECCKVLNLPVRDFDILYNMLDTTEIIYTNNLDRLLNSFRKLLICRDAYWKIAGEEMKLGKPWEPEWTNLDQLKYCIWVDVGEFVTMTNVTGQHILTFPTEEMRDAFYENFKEEIEICKELL